MTNFECPSHMKRGRRGGRGGGGRQVSCITASDEEAEESSWTRGADAASGVLADAVLGEDGLGGGGRRGGRWVC